MRKLILVLLALGAAVYGGFKGYIWYKVREELTSLTQSLEPFAKFTYGGISSTIITKNLNWSIEVKDINVQPNQTNDQIALGSVTLGSGSIRDLFSKKKFEQGLLPEHAGFMIKHLNVAIDSSFFSHLPETPTPASAEWPPYMSCSSQGAIAELKAMGYRSLEADVDLQYDWDRTAQNLLVKLRFHFNNMYAFQLEFDLQLSTSDLHTGSLLMAPPRLGKTSVLYQDDSYLERKLRYCAAQKKMEPEAYLKAYILSFDANLRALGVAVPAKTLKDYLGFLAAPDQIYFGISPSSPIDLQSLSVYTPRQLLEWLTPSLSFNNQPMAELSVQWLGQAGQTASQLPSVPKQLSIPGMESPASVDDDLIDAPANPKVKVDAEGKMVLLENLPSQKVVYAFRSVPPAKLASYIGRPVKLKTVNGKDFEGRLKGISGNRLTLEQPMQKGAATFELYLNQITAAQVYY